MSIDEDPFELALKAIAEHGNVSQALRDIDLPRKAFYGRIATDDEFGNRYARAKATGCHAVADAMREVQAEEPPMVQTKEGEHVDSGWVQWQRNKVELDKWLLARLMPKVYGERTTLSNDPDNPIPPLVVVKARDPSDV